LQQKDSRLAEIAMNAWYDEKDKAYEDWAKNIRLSRITWLNRNWLSNRTGVTLQV